MSIKYEWERDEYGYCWNGCYDEETDWIVETEIITAKESKEGWWKAGEKVVHCPKCGMIWQIDHVQVKVYPRHMMQRAKSSQYEGDPDE